MRRDGSEEGARILAIPGWQRQILDERLADLEEHPDYEQTWEEVKAELWPDLRPGISPG